MPCLCDDNNERLAFTYERRAPQYSVDRALMHAAADIYFAHREFKLFEALLPWELRESIVNGEMRFTIDNRTFDAYTTVGRELGILLNMERGPCG